MVYYVGHIEFYVESGEEMSFLIAQTNQHGIVIASDSRLTMTNGINDEFLKVFRSKIHQRIWGIVGYYGKNLELLDMLNKYIDTAEKIEEQKIEQILTDYIGDDKTKTTNIFIGEIKDEPVLTVFDYFNGRFVAQKNIKDCTFFAGSDEETKEIMKEKNMTPNSYGEMVCCTVRTMDSIISLAKHKEILRGKMGGIGGVVVCEGLRN